jgi:hypothetical protein
VTITDATPGSLIYYTTDGTTPTTSSLLYSGPITLSNQPAQENIQAIAVLNSVAGSVAGGVYTIAPSLATPSFSPAQGTYIGSQQIKLTASTPGSVIYYTTNGTVPGLGSSVYTGTPITVSQTESITAFAAGVVGYSPSAEVRQSYTITPQAATPVSTPAANTFPGPVAVTLSDSTSGSKIYYTLDGTYPTVYSKAYTGPITVGQNLSLRAVAVASGYATSGASFAAYRIQAATPSISPSTGVFTTPQTVTLTNSAANTTLFYTTDGSTPTTSSTRYAKPFLLGPTTGTTTISVLATATGYVASPVAQAKLTFDLPKNVIATAEVQSAVAASVPSTFLGLSHEWTSAPTLLGSSTTGVNTVYRTLLQQLSDNMHGALILRIGGGSTDTSGMPTTTTTQPFEELATALNVKYILGVNLGSNDLSLAESQADNYLTSLPEQIAALEIGNEPDGYSGNGLRSSTYSYAQFLPQYQQWANGIKSTQSSAVPFAGPTLGTDSWVPNALIDVADGALKANIVTQHKYVGCYYASSPLASDILLQPASAAPSLWYLQPYALVAHAVGSQFRIGELNSICDGGQPGVSNSFSSALWAIDTMFGYANAGIDGVNWHSGYQNGAYDLFYFGVWKRGTLNAYSLNAVRPLFYGLLFFSQAAGNGAQILNASTLTDANLKIWATKDSTGVAHLVIINKEQTTSGNVQITIPGYTAGTIVRLKAANYLATSGVTIGGQTFDGSTDGTLQGTPVTERIAPTGDVWTVSVDAMSAVLVNLTSSTSAEPLSALKNLRMK